MAATGRDQAMKLRLSSNYREGKPPPPAFFEVSRGTGVSGESDDLQHDGLLTHSSQPEQHLISNQDRHGHLFGNVNSQ